MGAARPFHTMPTTEASCRTAGSTQRSDDRDRRVRSVPIFDTDTERTVLQAEQAECLGVVWKPKISVMTGRRRRLEPLDPEGEGRRKIN